MAFSLKIAEEKLVKIAGAIQKQAAEKTYFICDDCNHTANLAVINQRRKEAAEASEAQEVEAITVNDELTCPVPGCSGTMHYAATAESERYYVESEDEKPDPEDSALEEITVKDKEDNAELPPEDRAEDAPMGEEPPVDEPPAEGTMEDKSPVEGPVEDKPPVEGPVEEKPPTDESIDLDFEDQPPMGEEPPMLEAPKAPKKKKDKPDDGKVTFPKEEVPKFEKSKEASDDYFYQAVARYTV